MVSSIAILVTGAEVLDGRVVDTNSSFMASQLRERGMVVGEIRTLPDSQPLIVEGLRALAAKHAVIIVSGGLGPTTDDLTREAVAEFTGTKLEENLEVRARLEAFYQERRRVMSPTNLKQATFPTGSTIIPNPRGTAPGFSIRSQRSAHHEVVIAAVPGVPAEMRPMFEESLLPLIQSRVASSPPLSRLVMRIFGLPESEVGARIEQCRLDSRIEVSYRAAFPEIQVILKATESSLLTAAKLPVEKALGEHHIFSRTLDDSLESIVHELLRASSTTVAVAESCTGGHLGALLTRTPGSSATFVGGVMAYSNEVKSSLLGVPAELIQRCGAVSAEVARAMAEGVRTRLDTTYALSITGIAGPSGQTDGKPVGTFFVGFASPDTVVAFRYFYPSFRDRVRTFAAMTALDLLRRHLSRLPLRNETPE